MDFKGSDPAVVAEQYVRSFGAEFSDDDIRRALTSQGFPAAAIEEGLRRVGPRPAAAPPVATGAASGREPRSRAVGGVPRKVLLVVGLVGGTVVFAFGALVVSGPRQRGARSGLPPELAGYKPVPLADPVHLPQFLPEDLVDGDAGEEYAKFVSDGLALLSGRPPTPSKEAYQAVFNDVLASLEQNRPLSSGPQTGAEILAAGLRKKRCSLMGTHFAIGSQREFVDYTEASLGFFTAASQFISEQAKQARNGGDWDKALRLSRTQAVLGWQMLQDWDFTTQWIGATVVVGALAGEDAAKKKAAGNERFYDPDASRAMLDVMAYLPDKSVSASILTDAEDVSRLPRLAERLRDPRQRRPYAEWTILAVAFVWSRDEAAAAAPSPARTAFLDEFARDPDARMARLAAGGANIVRDIEVSMRAASPAERDLLRRQLADGVFRLRQ